MDEEQFLSEMVAAPNDPTPRLVMADWLEERGDPRAELMRIQEDLRRIDVPHRQQLEARMQQLLLDGVMPVAPRMTNSLGMPFVFIFPGEFLMTNEGSKRSVTINCGFWIGETVVTQKNWQDVVGGRPWANDAAVPEHPDRPATHVDGCQARSFCEQLSETETALGFSYDLPHQTQWEYACRAGTTTRFSFGNDARELGEYAWYTTDPFSLISIVGGKGLEPDGTKSEDIHAAQIVGLRNANPWGLFDMHGNIWEWCKDQGQDLAGPYQVARGGCWRDDASGCRSALRLLIDSGCADDRVGFRLVASSLPHRPN